jgi:hypothetical protein
MFIENGYSLLTPEQIAAALDRQRGGQETTRGSLDGLSVTPPVEVSCPGACVPCSVSPDQAAAIAQGAAGAVAMSKGAGWLWAAVIFGVGYWLGRRS